MSTASILNPARRKFLRSVPAAAAAGFTLTNASLFAATAAAQGASAPALTFKLFKAQEIQDDLSALAANPGNNNLVQEKTFVVVLTTEKAKSGAEFEWHEHRDHVFQIVDGLRAGRNAEGRAQQGARRMARTRVGRAPNRQFEQRRHAGGGARHTAPPHHRWKRYFFTDFAAGKLKAIGVNQQLAPQ